MNKNRAKITIEGLEIKTKKDAKLFNKLWKVLSRSNFIYDVEYKECSLKVSKNKTLLKKILDFILKV